MQLKWPMLWDLFSLFPAYAGVIPESIDVQAEIETFPRIRGGDPLCTHVQRDGKGFSPHTRG